MAIEIEREYGFIVAMLFIATMINIFFYVARQRKKRSEWSESVRAEAGEKLSGLVFTVLIRQRDGKITELENILAGTLINCGAKVLATNLDTYKLIMSENDWSEVPDGAIALVGYTWDIVPSFRPVTYRLLSLTAVKRDGQVLLSDQIVSTESRIGYEEMIVHILHFLCKNSDRLANPAQATA